MVRRGRRGTAWAANFGFAWQRMNRLRRQLGYDEAGASAVEFAMLVPMMLILYLGAVELGDGLTVNRKVTHVSSTLADLVTQSKVLSNADMTNILNAAASIVTPYDQSKLKIKVTAVKIDGNNKATVYWSDAKNDTPLVKDSTIAIPAEVNQKDSFLVTTEVHYDYTPNYGYAVTGSFDLKDKFYLRPRLSNTIERIP